MTPHERSASDDEIVGVGIDGRRVRLFPPVLGTLCTSCGTRADDVCVIVESPTGPDVAAGLCGTCLIDTIDALLDRR
jgi:hypothetical protein